MIWPRCYSPYTVTEMFDLQTALILNAFQCQARLLELADREKEKDTGADDRSRRDQKEKDHKDYVESGIERLRRWERKISGK